MCDFCERNLPTRLIQLTEPDGTEEPWAVELCEGCIQEAAARGHKEKVVPCKTCGSDTPHTLVRECNNCYINRLGKDATDNHGWTEEMVESMKIAQSEKETRDAGS